MTDGTIFREDEEKIWIRLDTGQWRLLFTDTVVDQPWSCGCTLDVAMLGSTVDTCYASALLVLLEVFFVKENAHPEVDSRPALLGSLEKCAQFCLKLLELLHFEIWTLFQEPRVSGSQLSAV